MFRKYANRCFVKVFPNADLILTQKELEREKALLEGKILELELENQKSSAIFQNSELEKQEIIKINKYLFKKQYINLRKVRKIKVGFLVFFYEHWDSLDSVYRELCKDSNFEPIVLIGPRKQFVNRWRFLKEAEEYFDLKKINYLSLFNKKDKTWSRLTSLDLDLVIVNTPWEGSFPEKYHIAKISNYLKVCYIPYGIMSAKLQEHQFNQPFHHMCWKIFAESSLHKEMFKKYSDIGDKNVILTGYPKLDVYRKPKIPSPGNLWKLGPKTCKRRIIWAPHWTVGTTSSLLYSAFMELKDYFYEFAKSNPNIEIMIKPHPGLWDNLKTSKLMNSKEIEEMKSKFSKLPNLWFYEKPGYFDYFITSDAIILDSISFISEYYPTKKPLFFITKPGLHQFNEYGDIIMKGVYKGWGVAEVDNFIKDVVVQGNDPMYNTRKDIRNRYIYMPSESAAGKIVNYLKKEITNAKSSR